ncbi:MAG TPA: hypothetical protein VMR81_03765 [Patescibacteria group bacterium]|nr:hypothetical protein [Patescibacteria group bacterium]
MAFTRCEQEIIQFRQQPVLLLPGAEIMFEKWGQFWQNGKVIGHFTPGETAIFTPLVANPYEAFMNDELYYKKFPQDVYTSKQDRDHSIYVSIMHMRNKLNLVYPSLSDILKNNYPGYSYVPHPSVAEEITSRLTGTDSSG